ncbi:MAG: 3-dehydroquinate synthase, partial [Actinobacteria bacterium]
MPVDKMILKSKIHDYEVCFIKDCQSLTKYTDQDSCVFIVDENVWRFHKDGCLKEINENFVVILPISEDKKNLESVQMLYDALMEHSAKRNMTVVSIGGGITQDISGFMASSLYRGIKWIYYPTTLLAQADSCIGSKTSLNYKNYKNLIGTFYPPNEIYIYTPFLKTQEDGDYFSGLGEVLKLHLMGTQDNIDNMVSKLPQVIIKNEEVMLETIKNSLAIKRSYMEGDEFDTGRRNLLNYGHCFGHAIESATDFLVPHGQAVVLGMILANRIALNRGLLDSDMEDHLAENLLKPVIKLDIKAL